MSSARASTRSPRAWAASCRSPASRAEGGGHVVAAIAPDQLGQPLRLIEDAGGGAAASWHRVPFAFGATHALAAEPLVEEPTRLPGQYEDAATGLHYNYWRDYDPRLGRYLQPDPIGLAGGDVNLYAYVWNDPLNRSDPYGLQEAMTLRSGAQIILKGAAAAGATALMDGPLPFGDVVGICIFVGSIMSSITGGGTDCNEHHTLCLHSSLADLPGPVYGSSRCSTCRDQCVQNDGVWPDIAITGSGAVRCDYWNFR